MTSPILRQPLKNARLLGSKLSTDASSMLTKHRSLSTKSNPRNRNHQKRGDGNENSTVAYYMGALAVFVFGISYASVPLYKVFCQMTGFGGTTQRVEESREAMEPVEGRPLKVYFTAGVHSAMPWKFIPTQKEVRIVPGETALAFYTVKNTADYAITGVATYNVYPPKAGLYFSKIQCFCFEEQRLGPNEEIDMPVFFFIDPEFCSDPAMASVQNITLSYTFFKTGDERKDSDPE